MKFFLKKSGLEWDKSAEVKKIVFYADGVEPLSMPVSRFEPYEVSGRDMLFRASATATIDAFFLPYEPKRAVKLNLQRDDIFYIRCKSEYSWEPDGKALYIPSSVVAVEDAGEKLAMHIKDAGEKDYLRAYTLHSVCGFRLRRTHAEIVPDAGADFVPPDGCKWGSGYGTEEHPRYDIVEASRFCPYSRVVRRWATYDDVESLQIAAPGFCRIEKDAGRLERESIAAAFKSCGISVSHYDIAKLAEKLDISLKA